MTKAKQLNEFINDINEDVLAQIKKYEELKHVRYYYDKTNKQVLFYIPIHHKKKRQLTNCKKNDEDSHSNALSRVRS